MDGNGRWAKKRGLPRIAGHRAGASAVKEAIKGARDSGVKILTLYTFSTENWKRPKYEVAALFKLLENYIDKMGANRTSIQKKRIEYVLWLKQQLTPAQAEKFNSFTSKMEEKEKDSEGPK